MQQIKTDTWALSGITDQFIFSFPIFGNGKSRLESPNPSWLHIHLIRNEPNNCIWLLSANFPTTVLFPDTEKSVNFDIILDTWKAQCYNSSWQDLSRIDNKYYNRSSQRGTKQADRRAHQTSYRSITNLPESVQSDLRKNFDNRTVINIWE